MGGDLPKVVCPGCGRDMRFTTAEPSVVRGLDSMTFHCDHCQTDTKREIKPESVSRR